MFYDYSLAKLPESVYAEFIVPNISSKALYTYGLRWQDCLVVYLTCSSRRRYQHSVVFIWKITLDIGVFPKWSRTFTEYCEISETDNHCGSILVSYTRGSRFQPFYCNGKFLVTEFAEFSENV